MRPVGLSGNEEQKEANNQLLRQPTRTRYEDVNEYERGGNSVPNLRELRVNDMNSSDDNSNGPLQLNLSHPLNANARHREDINFNI